MGSEHGMRSTRLLPHAAAVIGLAALALTGQAADTGTQVSSRYRLEHAASRVGAVEGQYGDEQLAVLEKLNRADRDHLSRLPTLVVPVDWNTDELGHSPLPPRYTPGVEWPTYLVIFLPGQVFGGYEFGALVRWGPISSGRRSRPTPSGLFALNWRSMGRSSTIDPDWFMRWYFNFANREGLAFHAYTLPGYPASHACIRLLERDARWLYEWGRPWTLDSSGVRVLSGGTPVLIVGRYDFDDAPPWRSLVWLSRTVELPAPPGDVSASILQP
jgi:hypothetical protein